MIAETPLYLATKQRHPRAIQTLLERGANLIPAFCKCLSVYDNRIFIDLLDYVADSDLPYNLLHKVTMCYDQDGYIAEHLINRYGYKVNAHDNLLGYAPMHWVAISGIYDVCEVLLEHGADADLPALEQGHTPLGMVVDRAICLQDEEAYKICEMLLNAGADPNAKHKGVVIRNMIGNDERLVELFNK